VQGHQQQFLKALHDQIYLLLHLLAFLHTAGEMGRLALSALPSQANVYSGVLPLSKGSLGFVTGDSSEERWFF
jgi:hypothetical protein